MRIIRTEMYFSRDDVPIYYGDRHIGTTPALDELVGPSPSVAFAWVKGNISAGRSVEELVRPEMRVVIEKEDISGVIDLLVQDVPHELIGLLPNGNNLLNPAVVNFILLQPIVIERSPPISILLKDLVNTTNASLLVGTYIGVQAVSDSGLLLFITVPGGILLVSSAVGIGRALEAGLQKAIAHLFDRNTQPP